MTASRFLVVCPTPPGRFDGVADYACWLAAHLAAYGPAVLVGLGHDVSDRADPLACLAGASRTTVASWQDLWKRRAEAPFAEGAVLVQYVPQLYLRGPDFGWCLLWLASVRLHGRPVLITAHEYAVPADSLKRAAARLLMNALMAVLGTIASQIVVTFDLPRRRIQRLVFWKARRVTVVPVGTNIPVATPMALGTRATVVCTVFGRPEAMHAPSVAALGAWMDRAGSRAQLRWITTSASAVRDFLARCRVPVAVEVVEQACAATVSELLASSDVCLAPIVDGVSTRRTTVIAALAHGLPIVGTDGAGTDGVFRQSEACLLSSPADATAFVRHLEAVVNDRALRRRMGLAARALFTDRFTWDRITDAYIASLAGYIPRPRRVPGGPEEAGRESGAGR